MKEHVATPSFLWQRDESSIWTKEVYFWDFSKDICTWSSRIDGLLLCLINLNQLLSDNAYFYMFNSTSITSLLTSICPIYLVSWIKWNLRHLPNAFHPNISSLNRYTVESLEFVVAQFSRNSWVPLIHIFSLQRKIWKILI